MGCRLKFHGYLDCEDGKMAEMETTWDLPIPVNVFIENYHEACDAKEGFYELDLYAMGSGIKVYRTEAEYDASDERMAPVSMIPVGTFPADPEDKTFKESPHILFSGKVVDALWDSEAEPGNANCCMLIETLGLSMTLYAICDRPVEKGSIVHGLAWLYASMPKEACGENNRIPEGE